MTVQSGLATITVNGNTVTIVAADNTHLNWQSFNIASGESTIFQQPSSTSIVWNNIGSQSASQIYGTLQANGVVVLMIILSIAVAGGPFIGLLGTVWGVMETFSGIAQANAATLTAMAPGVAAALIATVAGLLVAIPAMFAYNLMVTSIRHITQELDAFAARFATQIRFYYMTSRMMTSKGV